MIKQCLYFDQKKHTQTVVISSFTCITSLSQDRPVLTRRGKLFIL